MKKVTRNFYNKGLNRDTDKHQPQNQSLYWNENFRLITQEGQSNLLLENVKGNRILRDINNDIINFEQGYKIIGHYVFDNKDIVLFLINDVLGDDNYPTISRLYLLKYDYDNEAYLPKILLYEDTNNDKKGIGLRLKNNIDIVGRKETNYVRHIYWIDNDNPLRYANITPDIDENTGEPKEGLIEADYTRIQNQEPWQFDMLGRITNTDRIVFKGYGNGRLKAGKVEYAYRLYNKHGHTTNISQVSELIPIFNANITDNITLQGDNPDTETNKSVKLQLKLHGYNLKYDYVEIIGIYYYHNDSYPEIRITEQIKIPDKIENNEITINFEDNGVGYVDSISIEEFRLIVNDYIAKTIERKDDRLFIGNITEKYFDVDYDARSYRFRDFTTTPGDNLPMSALYEDINDTYNHFGIYNTVGIGTHIDWTNVSLPPEDHNCINRYNVLDNDGVDNYKFIYQSDGQTLGGEGPNVKYRFSEYKERHYLIDNDVDNKGTFYVNLNDMYKDMVDDVNDDFRWYTGIYRGFQRDEIYRFGITFFDNKGRQSFVKWISDIRMPDETQKPIEIHDNGQTYAQPLFLIFNIDNIPKNEDGTNMDWQIVYVKRTNIDRTVITSGFMLPMIETNYVNKPEKHNYFIHQIFQSDFCDETHQISKISDYVKHFISCDLQYNNIKYSNLLFKRQREYIWYNNYELEQVDRNIFFKIKKIISNDVTYEDIYNIKNLIDIFGLPFLSANITNHYSYSYEDASVNKIIEQNGTTTNLISAFVSRDWWNVGITNPYYYRSTIFRNFSFISEDQIAKCTRDYGYLKQNIYPYNGATYEDRLYNNYIFGTFINNGMTVNGDTHINYYENINEGISKPLENGDNTDDNYCFTRLDRVEGNDNIGLTSATLTVTESSVNIPFISGVLFYKNIGKPELTFIQLKNNKVTYTCYKSNGNIRSSWVLDYPDMFVYNPVYSVVSDSKIFYTKPQTWEKMVKFPTRIRYSDIKYNGEEKDSWLMFRPNNMQDVDTKYGELEQIVNFKNYLFAFQYRGMCLLPVNERATTSTSIGTPVVLGEGSVLPKFFNYSQGSEKYGLQNGNKVLKTESALYWIDVIEKKVLIFAGQTMELNFIKGLSAWLRDNIDEHTKYYAGYDNQFKEVLFSFYNQDTNMFNHTLVYNELIKAFQGIYTFRTNRFIMIPELLSIGLFDAQITLYKHNKGERVIWYEKLYDSVFEIIVNDETMMTKEFNNIEYMSEAFVPHTTTDLYFETLNTIQAFNDFLQTEEIELLPYRPGDVLYTGGLNIPSTAPNNVKNIRRRERMWRTTIPRVESNNPNIDNYRMRDAYVRLRLKYRNENSYKFIVHPITTYYSMSNLE